MNGKLSDTLCRHFNKGGSCDQIYHLDPRRVRCVYTVPHVGCARCTSEPFVVLDRRSSYYDAASRRRRTEHNLMRMPAHCRFSPENPAGTGWTADNGGRHDRGDTRVT
jgi:hypothetical protein